jgi:hypothetical protein
LAVGLASQSVGTAGATANVSERSFDQELAEKLPPG